MKTPDKRRALAFLGPSTLLVLSLAISNALAQEPRIVENPRPTWKPDEALRLAPTPTLVVGTQAGEIYEFYRVAGAARLTDGRIVVADGGSLSLRFFDSTGSFIESVGGRGEGPGEFQAMTFFSVVQGDTLVAGHFMRELSYFTGTGQYLERRVSPNPPMRIATELRVTVATLDGSGTRAIAAMPIEPKRGTGNRWVDSVPVTIVNGRNVEVRALGMLPGMELAMDDGDPRQPRFGATATFASDGKLLYIGLGAEYAIRVYTQQGRLSHIIRRAWTPVRVTKADIDAYVTEWGKRWIRATGAEAEAQRSSMREDPYAATVPAFSQFIADRVGRLWVREAHLADAPGAGALNTTPLVPSIWSVFDPAGRWLGDVTMPARFQPRDIGADYVLGTVMDEDGVESIALHRLEA